MCSLELAAVAGIWDVDGYMMLARYMTIWARWGRLSGRWKRVPSRTVEDTLMCAVDGIDRLLTWMYPVSRLMSHWKRDMTQAKGEVGGVEFRMWCS